MKQRAPFARISQAQANSRATGMEFERKPIPKFKYNYQMRKENQQFESALPTKPKKSFQTASDAMDMEIEEDQNCVFVNGRKYFIKERTSCFKN